MLLVMDNFEHLVAGASLLEEILSQAAGIKLLVTSRQRLNLPAEWVLEIHGLKFPQNGLSAPAESFSSVQLFLENARRAVVGFSPSAEDLPWVAQICRLVEGTPLGIELAASWVKLLSCREIAGEIERSLDFLESEQRGVPSRHKSLRAIFDHSWELLSPAEQDSFKRLSVFQGGCTKEAAAQVAGAGLPVLAALVDKSLLRRASAASDSGATRYDMHELLKQYAAAKLQESPDEAKAARTAHAHYYAQFLADRLDQIKGAAQLEAVRSIEVDLQNVRAAWRWAVEQVDLPTIETCMRALGVFFNITSRFQVGEELFGWAVERLSRQTGSESAPDMLGAALAFLRGAQGNFCMGTSHYERGLALMLASLSAADQIDDGENARPALHPARFRFTRSTPMKLAFNSATRKTSNTTRPAVTTGAWRSPIPSLAVYVISPATRSRPEGCTSAARRSSSASATLGGRQLTCTTWQCWSSSMENRRMPAGCSWKPWVPSSRSATSGDCSTA